MRAMPCSALIPAVLVGVAGAGKSTLAHHLCEEAEKNGLAWYRINQDVLKTRGKCYSEACRRLREGGSVVIDRTNLSRDQVSHSS